MIKAIRSFFGFWYGFIVGDDWTVAAAIGAALVITEALNQRGVVAWWLLPLTVVVATAVSLWRTGGAGPTRAPG
jgi:hypothetical protein